MRSTRREVFTSLLAAPALAGIAAAGFAKPEVIMAAPAENQEIPTPIIKARNEYFAARAAVDKISDEPAAMPRHPDHEDNMQRSNAACEKMWDCVSILANTDAINIHDLKAKAEVAKIEFTEYCEAFVMEASSDEVQLAASIINDFVRLHTNLT